MCIITLTRIFHLTYQYPTLVREVTTPSLPAFITSTLNLVSVKLSSGPSRSLKSNTPLLEPVLHALAELIARHPTIFRSFSAQIHSLLVVVLGSGSCSFFPKPVVDLAERLFVSLHFCAPKNTSGDEWRNAIGLTISSIHRTADNVFRAVVEHWESVDPNYRQTTKPADYSREVGDEGSDPLGLPGWQGLHSGVARLIGLLRLLSGFLSTPTASTVAIPFGHILDVTTRLTSVTAPLDDANAQLNLQIGREERDSLATELPRVHAACNDLSLEVVDVLGLGMLPAAQNVLEQTLWVFRAECSSSDLRRSTYDLIASLLSLMGSSLTKQNTSALAKVIRFCCSDLSPSESNLSWADSSTDSKDKSKAKQMTTNADSFLNPTLKQSSPKSTSSFPCLSRAASKLLSMTLMRVPSEYLSPSIRSEIDRTVILTAGKKAMLASVLNPIPAIKGRGAGSSILPFLTRRYPSEMEVEGLIRPRMPVITNAADAAGYTDSDDEEEDDVPNSMEHGPSDDTARLNTFLAARPGVQPAEAGITQPEPTSNKRGYTEESDTKLPAASSTAPEERREEGQIKKARFEENTQLPAETSSQKQSSVPVTATPGPSIQEPVVTATPASLPQQPTTSVVDTTTPARTDPPMPMASAARENPLASQSAQAATGVEDESDDEMPTLNAEPDTDDEDEDMED